MRIDTHQHFWKLDRGDYNWLTPELAPLYRDFLPGDLAPLLRENKIDGTITVQAAATEAETEFMLSLADRHDWIFGVVGWVDLQAPHAPRSIERLAKHPKLVGLRPMIQDIPDDDWILHDALGPAIKAMLDHDLTFDALVLPRHLANLNLFLDRYPGLSVVVNHCAKPEIRNNSFDPWASEIRDVAAHKNVFCKLSGLTTEASQTWAANDLEPYLAHIAEVFEPHRLLFGSDWPVLNLASDYTQWCSIISSIQESFPGQSQAPDMADNAQRAYPRMRPNTEC